jgi:hypothetical protein
MEGNKPDSVSKLQSILKVMFGHLSPILHRTALNL